MPELHLVHDSHEAMANHIAVGSHGQVAAIMFNLGYLPGADQSVITEPESTITALNSAIRLLRTGGIVTVVLYPGHRVAGQQTQAVERMGFFSDPYRHAKRLSIGWFREQMLHT